MKKRKNFLVGCKKIKRALSVLTAFAFVVIMFSVSVSAASNPYPTSQTINGISTVPCTWYAWQQAYDNTGVALPNFGNAKNWYSSASSRGYSVGTIAKAKSIAVWTNSGYGHVGYVVSVSGNTMRVNEGGMYNTNGTAYNGTGIINGSLCNSTVGSYKSSWSSSVLVGFIYLESAASDNIIYKTTSDMDTITNTNAILWAKIDKPSNASISELGIVVRKKCDTYENGWSKYHVPSKNYVGSTIVRPYFDMNEELGLTLSAGIEYCYQFYAMIDGKDYWSNEESFKTTGSHTTHQKGKFAYYLKSHPHYNSYYCTLCGEVYTEMSETNLLNNCESCYSLGKSIVKTDKQTYLLGEKVKITWSAVDKATHYNLWVLKKTANGDYVTVSRNDSLTGNSITISGLDIGEYQICHYTYNSNMWEKDNSDWRHTGSDYVYIKVEANAGWQHNSRGWWYRNSDGSYPASCWQWIDNAWYYFDASGYIVTGWQWIGNAWYYFNASGVMATGWQFVEGAWYYLNGSGLISTGWQWIGNEWYYFNASGIMTTGWQWIDGAWYFLYSSGAMASNCYIDGYYITPSGAMA